MKFIDIGPVHYFTLCILLSTTQLSAQVNDVQLYKFAHSLIDHRPPAIPTPSDETTIAHWMNDIAQTAGKTFATTGQFGQLTNHLDDLPPNSNLGYDNVPYSWDENTSSFANSNLNTILITPANFIQWIPPSEPDPSDPSGRTVLEMTENIFDWVNNEKPGMRYYIYGNWPEMDLQNAFPPTLPDQSEIDDYHDLTIGTNGPFANWWIEYQDQLVASRPLLNTRLIPVGVIISKLLKEIIPDLIPFDELYEDSAPHGRANIYFLAGMITYMAMYQENIPSTYMPSDIISPAIRNNLSVIRNYSWIQLSEFNFADGQSRVFYNGVLQNDEESREQEYFRISPNPVANTFEIESDYRDPFNLQIRSLDGKLIKSFYQTHQGQTIDILDLRAGVYILYFKDESNRTIFTDKMVKK